LTTGQREEFQRAQESDFTTLCGGHCRRCGLRSTAYAQGKTYYWISHGSPADPVWTYFLAAQSFGLTNRQQGQYIVPQRRRSRPAGSRKSSNLGRCCRHLTTSPDPGSLVSVVKEANAANIPIINFKHA